MIAILLLVINSRAWTKDAGREFGGNLTQRRSERTEVEFLMYAQCNWWWFLCFRGQVCVHSSHFYIFCLFDWHPKCLASTAKFTPLLILEKALKNLSFSQCVLYKNYFQHFEVSVAFPSHKEIVMHILCALSDIIVLFYWCTFLVTVFPGP